MQAAPIPPHLRALAPDLALRLAVILAGLAALVAARFLRNPRLAPLIVPLWGRLTRSARRFSNLMALFAAGRLPRHRPGRPGRPGGRAPKPPIPTANAWLIRELRHEAAAYGSQLAHLLAEPGIADLLAAAPAAQRILNPIRRALGLIPREPRPAPNPRRPSNRPAPPDDAPAAFSPRPPIQLCPRMLAHWPFGPFPFHVISNLA